MMRSAGLSFPTHPNIRAGKRGANKLSLLFYYVNKLYRKLRKLPWDNPSRIGGALSSAFSSPHFSSMIGFNSRWIGVQRDDQ